MRQPNSKRCCCRQLYWAFEILRRRGRCGCITGAKPIRIWGAIFAAALGFSIPPVAFGDLVQQQVLVETKFLEVNVKAAQRLGIDQRIAESLGKLPPQNSALTGTTLGFGAGPSPEVVDARLFPSGGAPGALNVSAMMTGPQLQSILKSFEGETAVKTTSAPAVTTPTGQSARIAEPSFASGGVVLEFQPRIQPDGRIGLTLVPQVADFAKTTNNSTIGAGDALLLSGVVPLQNQVERHLVILVTAKLINVMTHSPGADTAGSQIKVTTQGTGNTVGHVADLKIQNLINETISFVIPALILESRSGRDQDYACPHQQEVVIGPNDTEIVPMNGVCVNRDKPPAGKGTANNLVINTADPGVPQYPDCRTTGKEARDLLRLTEAKYESVDKLQKDGALKEFPYQDEQKQRDILLQWSTWTDPRVCTIEKSPPATKRDLEKVVYKQAEKAPSRETRKKLEQGIDTIFENVELTNEKAKSLEKPDPFAAVELTGEKAKSQSGSASPAQPTAGTERP